MSMVASVNTEARCATVAGLLEALNLTAVAYVLEPPPPQAVRVNSELPDKSKGLTPKACKKFLLLLSVGGLVCKLHLLGLKRCNVDLQYDYCENLILNFYEENFIFTLKINCKKINFLIQSLTTGNPLI